MKTIIYQTIQYGENLKLIRKLEKRESPEEYPHTMRYAVQTVYFNGEDWIQICRIYNYYHDGQTKSRIHIGKDVKWVELNFEEAQVLKLTKDILKKKYNEDGEY